MPRRKKQSLVEECLSWFKLHRRLSWALVALLLLLSYVPLHTYHTYADTRKLHQARSAIDNTYDTISERLGEPANLKRLSSCSHESAALRSLITCRVETDFVYGLSTQDQANVLLKQIQLVIGQSRSFKPTQKPASRLSNNLIFDTVYHNALDNYSGPHHIACSVKYSFDTPDEVNLSINQPHRKAFEVFFTCSAQTSKAVY